MSTIINFPQFRYLIYSNLPLDSHCANFNTTKHCEASESGCLNIAPDAHSTLRVKKTNSFSTALNIVSQDPEAQEIFDNQHKKVIFVKRKIY